MLYFDKDRTFVLHRGCERTILSRWPKVFEASDWKWFLQCIWRQKNDETCVDAFRLFYGRWAKDRAYWNIVNCWLIYNVRFGTSGDCCYFFYKNLINCVDKLKTECYFIFMKFSTRNKWVLTGKFKGGITMKLVPLGDKIVLKQLEAEETTKSGNDSRI